MERLVLICGFPQTSDVDAIQRAITARAEREERQVLFHFCGSKIEVEHAVACAEAGSQVLLQELFVPIDPYQAWELSALRDIREVKITVSLSKKHYGSSYLAVLYAAGILDAVYEDEATAARIADYIFYQRGRKSCREYYGISIAEAMEAMQIIDQSLIKRYVHHIGTAGGQESMVDRFVEIASRLDLVQKQFLASQLPPEFVQVLKEYGCLEGLMPEGSKKDKKRRKFL